MTKRILVAAWTLVHKFFASSSPGFFHRETLSWLRWTADLLLAGVLLQVPSAVADDWAPKFPATIPPARSSHAMAYDAARGQVVLFGGLGANNNALSDTWVWDGSNWTQKSPANNVPARSNHAMAYDSLHQQIVLFGGANGAQLSDTWV
jgi:hypothetical protein